MIFQVVHHAEICQFDRFSLEINFEEHVFVIMEFPDWVQVKKIYHSFKAMTVRSGEKSGKNQSDSTKFVTSYFLHINKMNIQISCRQAVVKIK